MFPRRFANSKQKIFRKKNIQKQIKISKILTLCDVQLLIVNQIAFWKVFYCFDNGRQIEKGKFEDYITQATRRTKYKSQKI
jgi:hypothetical protein